MTGLEDPPQITRASEQNGIHLIVLQHGLWGKAANLHMVDVCLRKEADQRGVNVVMHTSCLTCHYIRAHAVEQQLLLAPVSCCSTPCTSMLCVTLS